MNRYQKIQKIRNENEFVGTIGDLYYRTTYYPEIEPQESDIYVETEFGDRLDSLANQYYFCPKNSSSLHPLSSI